MSPRNPLPMSPMNPLNNFTFLKSSHCNIVITLEESTITPLALITCSRYSISSIANLHLDLLAYKSVILAELTLSAPNIHLWTYFILRCCPKY